MKKICKTLIYLAIFCLVFNFSILSVSAENFNSPNGKAVGQGCIKDNTGNLGYHENKNNEGNKCGIQEEIVIPTDPNEPNNKPIAVIGIIPSEGLTTNTFIYYDYSYSYDIEGDTIINAEWRGTQDYFTNAGIYTISLRVQDEHGLWSDWAMMDIIVQQ